MAANFVRMTSHANAVNTDFHKQLKDTVKIVVLDVDKSNFLVD